MRCLGGVTSFRNQSYKRMINLPEQLPICKELSDTLIEVDFDEIPIMLKKTCPKTVRSQCFTRIYRKKGFFYLVYI